MKALYLIPITLLFVSQAAGQTPGFPEIDYSFSKYIQTEKKDSNSNWDTITVGQQSFYSDERVASQSFDPGFNASLDHLEGLGIPMFFPQLVMAQFIEYMYSPKTRKLDSVVTIVNRSSNHSRIKIFDYTDSTITSREVFCFSEDTFFFGPYIDVLNTHGQLIAQYWDSTLVRKIDYTESGKIKTDVDYQARRQDSIVYDYDGSDNLISKMIYTRVNDSLEGKNLFFYSGSTLSKQEIYWPENRLHTFIEYQYDNRNRLVERNAFRMKLYGVDGPHHMTKVNYAYDERGRLIEVISSNEYYRTAMNKYTLVFDEPLGLDEAMSTSEIRIFPNPSNGFISISADDVIQSISVFDLKGVVLKEFTSNTASIDLSGFPSGVYFLKLDSDSGSQIKKVMIQ